MKHYFILLCLSIFALGNLSAEDYTYSNNWYVGDTEAGEWIKHKHIKISAGDYRFTLLAVAYETGKTVSLALNDEIVFSQIEIPANVFGTFQSIHLGSKALAEGYYDVKLIFDTGDVNGDLIFIKKDSRTDNTVLDTDLEYALNHSDGMHIAPIAGAAEGTCSLAKYGDQGDNITYYFQGNPGNDRYTREQVMMWNKQPIYTYHHEYTQDALDTRVQEFVESKVDFIWAHGRGEPDQDNEILDRDFKNGAGAMPCTGLTELAKAIKRNPYAKDNLKIAYFFDNAATFTSAGSGFYTGQMNYGSKDFQKFVWEFAVKKWYAAIPKELLFTLPDTTGQGRTIVPMQWWTCGIGSKWGSNNKELGGSDYLIDFFNYIAKQMQAEFGLTPAWVLDNTFFKYGTKLRNDSYGIQAWFIWGREITDIQALNGRKFAFALNGGRIPMHGAVQTDWNPYTGEGTYVSDNASQNATKGFHVSSLDENGEPRIRSVFEQGTAENAEWIVLESWFDWHEGSTWFRSGHREYAYPNQHLNLCREFADKETSSILLEAESCDEFYDLSAGNSGGSYRLDWYKESELKKDYWDANFEVDLDVFRPLHQLSPIRLHEGTLKLTPSKIYAGLKDVWLTAGSNDSPFGNELDGYPVDQWRALASYASLQDLALGGYSAWGITTDGNLVKCTLPNEKLASTNNPWTEVKSDGIKIVDIDANDAMIWGVDDQTNIYYRNFAGTRPWTKVEGKLTSIAVDNGFGWGFDPEGNLKCFNLQSKSGWKTVANPHQLTFLSAGCEEVWGINAKNEVYRLSSSGFGSWQKVADGFADVSVGANFVWLLDMEGNRHFCELNSFTDRSVFTTKVYNGIVAPKTVQISVKAYPNPFADRLTVSITSNTSKNIDVSVLSIDGKTVYRTTYAVKEGTNELELGTKLQALPSGIYLLVIEKPDREVIRIIK
ncbi:hypothetical protein AGMMS50262_21790 [Bacteroidia bacterium]|nr:hypothetical protein AGMMS50262_21790 [Bacteroidia bacterium]